jgi:hypothetical protein
VDTAAPVIGRRVSLGRKANKGAQSHTSASSVVGTRDSAAQPGDDTYLPMPGTAMYVMCPSPCLITMHGRLQRRVCAPPPPPSYCMLGGAATSLHNVHSPTTPPHPHAPACPCNASHDDQECRRSRAPWSGETAAEALHRPSVLHLLLLHLWRCVFHARGDPRGVPGAPAETVSASTRCVTDT